LPRRISFAACAGGLAAHYAAAHAAARDGSDLLLELAATLTKQGSRVAVLALSALQPLLRDSSGLRAPADAARYAHRSLMPTCAVLDAAGMQSHTRRAAPAGPAWAAVNDRLGARAVGSRERVILLAVLQLQQRVTLT
jgi:hypothetical protein